MQVLLGLLLVHASMALPVFYLEGNELDYKLTPNSLVHVQFPASCETNCRASFSFAAPAGKLELAVLQDPRKAAKLFVSAENTAALRAQSGLVLDASTLTAYRRVQRIEETLSAEKTLVLNVLATSLEARFALLVGPRIEYDFWQLTVGFPLLVQNARQWSGSFYFPYLFGGLALVYFLAWPLRRKRPRVQRILSSLAGLSLLAWVADAFVHYFVAAQETRERHVGTFFLHVVGNVCFLLVLFQTQDSALPTRRVASLSVALLSLLNGGAGLYLCPALLFLDQLFLREAGTQQRSVASVLCKQV